MKKIISILVFSFLFNTVFGQLLFYSFTKSTGTYSNLTSSSIIENGNWKDVTKGIKMPFSFNYWGTPIGDSLFIDDFGSLSLTNDFLDEINFLNDDLDSRGLGKSPISYKVTGSAPNRILMIEYQNAGFSADVNLKDSVNAQCWLYETSNIIEFRYGPNFVKSTTWTDGGAFVGIADGSFTKGILLSGNPSKPTVNEDITNFVTLTGTPLAGTIYTFTPSKTAKLSKIYVKINSERNKAFIASSESENILSLKIFNISGQEIISNFNMDEIDLSNINPGLYFVLVETNSGFYSQKLCL